MKERPIIFGAESVKAILAGNKVQTRRVLKPQPEPYVNRVAHIALIPPKATGEYEELWWSGPQGDLQGGRVPRCPHGRRGDRLWVREVWGDRGSCWSSEKPKEKVVYVQYAADGLQVDIPRPDGDDSGLSKQVCRCSGWRSPLFMPRWASRLTLEITDVRVERLQEISEADAVAEGMVRSLHYGKAGINGSAKAAFAALWDSINGKRRVPGNYQPWRPLESSRTETTTEFSWAANPWVFAITFRAVECAGLSTARRGSRR